MANLDDRLDLLLAFDDENEHSPVLGGFAGDAAERAPKPKPSVDPDESHGLARGDAEPNNLALQRWAVIAPNTREGDKMLEAIAPLISLREKEQGVDVIQWRVPAGMSAKDAVQWKEKNYHTLDLEEDDRPLYLCLLGDLRHISTEFHHVLGHASLVGRVHFSREDGEVDYDGYAAYAQKVVRYARNPTAAASPDLLFYCAPDGSKATAQGGARLITPGLEMATKSYAKGKLDVASVARIEAETTAELLEQGNRQTPSVLLSVSHGLGAPRSGWKSEEEQWKRQGAVLIRDNEVLDADQVREKPFLPGGLWFCLACFGAGTPATSAYAEWLEVLARDGSFQGKPSSVLASLPQRGADPFVAALPQAALRNPAGPLGVIGHLDLAWSYAFTDPDQPRNGRAGRIVTALEIMARGSRVGLALDSLMSVYRETNDKLNIAYKSASDAERARLWMLRNDLRGYVLLGDPAARLPIAKNVQEDAKAAESPPEIKTKTGEASPMTQGKASAFGRKTTAALALLRGAEAPAEIAKRAGATLDEVFSWYDAFMAAGRQRLGE